MYAASVARSAFFRRAILFLFIVKSTYHHIICLLIVKPNYRCLSISWQFATVLLRTSFSRTVVGNTVAGNCNYFAVAERILAQSKDQASQCQSVARVALTKSTFN